jgi:hypothetical protein
VEDQWRGTGIGSQAVQAQQTIVWSSPACTSRVILTPIAQAPQFRFIHGYGNRLKVSVRSR